MKEGRAGFVEALIQPVHGDADEQPLPPLHIEGGPNC